MSDNLDDLLASLEAAGLHPISIREITPGEGRAPPMKDQILPEARIMQLREWEKKISAPNPFARGDLVRVAPYTGLTIGTEPSMVVETRVLGNLVEADMGHGDVRFFNTRIIAIMPEGKIATCWVEHWQLERYVEKS